jgi:hypothetical protein
MKCYPSIAPQLASAIAAIPNRARWSFSSVHHSIGSTHAKPPLAVSESPQRSGFNLAYPLIIMSKISDQIDRIQANRALQYCPIRRIALRSAFRLCTSIIFTLIDKLIGIVIGAEGCACARIAWSSTHPGKFQIRWGRDHHIHETVMR